MNKKYLNDEGLTKVAEYVNNKPYVFQGTSDQWAALSTAEKAKYENGLVVLSDIDTLNLNSYNGERIMMHNDLATTITYDLEPNVCHFINFLKDELTINLVGYTPGIINEYHFFFITGSTPTVLNLPSGVIKGDFTVKANCAYEISILENFLVYHEWSRS